MNIVTPKVAVHGARVYSKGMVYIPRSFPVNINKDNQFEDAWGPESWIWQTASPGALVYPAVCPAHFGAILNLPGACDTKDPGIFGHQHHCCTSEHPEVCPTDKFLSTMTDVEVWAEGVEGDFHIELQWVRAAN